MKEEEIEEHFSATTIEDAANVTINGSDTGPVSGIPQEKWMSGDCRT